MEMAAAFSSATVARKGVALVVDDELANRRILLAMLKREGYSALLAENGAQAVQMFGENAVDIVLMDVMMPDMDGYEATRRIKALAQSRFVPVIFLTALEEEAALVKCVEAGGDDFLVKPYKMALLHAKIVALERIRVLQNTVESQNLEIRRMYNHLQREEEIAEHIFSGAVFAGNLVLPQMRTLIRSAATFSGDVVLTAHAPSGELYVLAGDFTGHGLSAAIGALPTSEVFRAMTAKGYPMPEILSAINNKLRRLLPKGMFMAGCFVVIDKDLRSVSIWNGNMPEVLVLDAQGQIKHRAGPEHLPLGIRPESEQDFSPKLFEIESGDRVLLCSDGVMEAQSADGERFGSERYLQSALQKPMAESFNAVVAALEAFCADHALADDISLVEIPCIPDILNKQVEDAALEPRISICKGRWQWALELHGPSLRQASPVPLALSHLQEVGGLHAHSQQLFMILTELYCNALDHGVLGLSSAIKATNDGFARYYEERETRLMQLQEGFVALQVEHRPNAKGGEILIRVQDSGAGFALSAVGPVSAEDNDGYCGRGIMLLRGVCASVEYRANGTLAEAVYAYADETSNA